MKIQETIVFGKEIEGRGYVPILRPSIRNGRKSVSLVLPSRESVQAWQTTPGEIFLSWTTHMTAAEVAQTSVSDMDTDVTVTDMLKPNGGSTNDRVIDYLGHINSSAVKIEKADYTVGVMHMVGHDTQTVVLMGSGLEATDGAFFPLSSTIERTGTPIVSRLGPYVMDKVLPLVQWES